MLTIKYQAAFKKDYKRIVKRGYDFGVAFLPGHSLLCWH